MTYQDERCPDCKGRGAVRDSEHGPGVVGCGPAEKGAVLCHKCKGFGWIAKQTVKLNRQPEWAEEE